MNGFWLIYSTCPSSSYLIFALHWALIENSYFHCRRHHVCLILWLIACPWYSCFTFNFLYFSFSSIQFLNQQPITRKNDCTYALSNSEISLTHSCLSLHWRYNVEEIDFWHIVRHLLVLFVYFSLSPFCCPLLLSANPGPITVEVPWPTLTFFKTNQYPWYRTQSKHLHTASLGDVNEKTYLERPCNRQYSNNGAILIPLCPILIVYIAFELKTL